MKKNDTTSKTYLKSGIKNKNDNNIDKKNSESSKQDKCQYFKKCGGCRYINLSYEEQLKAKQQSAVRFLKDIADSQKIKIENIIGSEQQYNYRNKVHSVFALDQKMKVARGIYREDSHKVVDIKSCFLENKKANEIIEEIRKLLPSFKYKVYDEDTETGWLRHVLVRIGNVSGNGGGLDGCNKMNIMLVLVTATVPFVGKNNFIKAITTKFPEITTIVQNINDKRTSMVLGDRNIICYGKGYIEDELLELKFRISPNSFYQVNPSQTSRLYSEVKNMVFDLPESKTAETDQKNRFTIIDTYCGTGTIGMCLAKDSEKVIGVELNPSAVKDARSNAKANGIKNIEFVCADATKWIQEYELQLKEMSGETVLIMDPPRSGSTEKFITSVSNAGIRQVIYVSCNPETLARDLRSFIKKHYKIRKIVPLDMFPWTEHIETIVKISK